MERQASAAPAPGAAAAEVRRAFAKITSSSGSSSVGTPVAKSNRDAYSFGAQSSEAGRAEQPSSAAFPAPTSASQHKPVVPRLQLPVAATGTGSSNHQAVSQFGQDRDAADAVQHSYESSSQASSLTDRSSDQHALPGMPSDQKAMDADSSARQGSTQRPFLPRAVSLKGAAAADTARAFSRLRSRTGKLSVGSEQLCAPASSPRPVTDEAAAAAAQSPSPDDSAVRQSQHASQQPEEADSQIAFMPQEQHAEASCSANAAGMSQWLPDQVLNKLIQSTGEQAVDLWASPPAAQTGRPEDIASSSRSSASTDAAEGWHTSSHMATVEEEAHISSRPSMFLPESAFATELEDRSESPRASLGSPRRSDEAGGRSQVKLPHSRADGKGASPRKRATLGRRLSGIIPGIKGKERARASSASKEVQRLMDY